MINKFNKYISKNFYSILVFYSILLRVTPVFASGLTTTTFQPIIDLVFLVLKVAGVLIGALGLAKLLLSFSNEQPESRYSGVMQIITGVAMFFSSDILAGIGLTL